MYFNFNLQVFLKKPPKFRRGLGVVLYHPEIGYIFISQTS